VTAGPGRRTRVRGLLAALLAAGLVAAAAVAFVANRKAEPPAPVDSVARKPTLMLLTTLPLVFGEKFGLEGGGSPALSALGMHYRVLPIAVTSEYELAHGRLLLMAHPQAQTAEGLVTLDRWVRQGGRLLLLADPALDWPSELPLGDRLRPPPAFADTGLLRHWGLRLDAPDDRGPKMRRLGGQEIMTASPGELFGDCATSADRLVAHCRIGKGEATIVADADFLNVEDLDGPTSNNLNAMLAELESLER
jgi:hypothetical protein